MVKVDQRNQVKRAWWATGIWVVLCLIIVISKGTSFFCLSLNELGDMFAGFVAPLAFLWLVVGYFQTGFELKQNTEALENQREEIRLQTQAIREQQLELKKQAEEQRRLATATEDNTQAQTEYLNIENVKNRKEAQPDFRYKILKNNSPWALILTNVGGDIADVTFKLNNDDGKLLMNRSTLSVKNGEEVSVTLVSGARNLTLEVEYTDIYGHEGVFESVILP